MDFAGLVIPLVLVLMFVVSARILRALGLRPDEPFALPDAGRGRTTTA